MFISKRSIRENYYYYLEDRVGGKRISLSLGQKSHVAERVGNAFDGLVQRVVLEKLRVSQKKFKARILSVGEQLVLERLKEDYLLLKVFFPQGFESFKEDEFVRYAQGSASVEGNSLSLQEAALVLQKGTSIAGKRIEEIKEIENMKLAAGVSKKIKKISEKNIKKINAAILKGFDEKYPGEYRAGPIFITGSQVRPPPAGKVKKEMQKLVLWLEKNRHKMHPIELACEFHARFEEIHPFNDGNGRTGRELLNNMLAIKGYPRAIINLENRQSYIALLERVQLSKEYCKFSKFVYLCLEKGGSEISKILAENKKTILEKITKKAMKNIEMKFVGRKLKKEDAEMKSKKLKYLTKEQATAKYW